ncbi:MAG: acyl-CoA/acyl-ACP dehydrogenase, partial [Proteobacteria bacterium]|nr:acyl-CoA/acyl-ACP dehydrogenase [Pseudomonadota bacterium]
MSEYFSQTEDQRAILETVRRFCEEVVVPVAAELDQAKKPEDGFSWDIIEKSDAVGLRTLTLSEEYDGLGIDSLTTAMVVEELGKADLGISVVFAQTLKLLQILQTATTPEQRARYLPMYRDDPRFLLAIGITEPETASNYFVPKRAKAPFRTQAVKADGGWILNGMKHFISNGNVASLYLVFAQTEKGKPLDQASTCFLLERDTPGFSIGRVHDKMGERLANNAELIFEDCFIADENVIGEIGNGFDVLVKFFPQSNAYAAASILGVAGAAYERALDWAQTRVQGGKRLIEHDGITADLSEMRMLLDVSRTYIHKAAWLAENQEQGWDPTLGVFPKVMASQAAWKIVTRTLELH